MSAFDDFALYETSPGSHRHAAAVTPSDSASLSNVSRMLFVGGAGNLAVVMQDGTNCTFTGILAGTLLPVAVSQVMATGTTATNIVSLY